MRNKPRCQDLLIGKELCAERHEQLVEALIAYVQKEFGTKFLYQIEFGYTSSHLPNCAYSKLKIFSHQVHTGGFLSSSIDLQNTVHAYVQEDLDDRIKNMAPEGTDSVNLSWDFSDIRTHGPYYNNVHGLRVGLDSAENKTTVTLEQMQQAVQEAATP
ncbi:hypothetical protein KJ652_02870 [Patescibacteria group bacterium]|nr:hypothetical protein [Patescibacteria group bacterium]MBU1123509.1 hypothetical protein [Patescibacteria group bacterium]MBU1911313.1 hypothetical protein [Patescibacteria group bacterium]